MINAPFKILLVEDSPTDRLFTLEALREAGLDQALTVLENGAEAIDHLRSSLQQGASCRPDLILLDLNLPKVDGRRVLEFVKQDPDLKSIPVVVVTTSAAEEDVVQAYRQHANSYVVKPIDYEQFRQSISVLGAGMFAWWGRER